MQDFDLGMIATIGAFWVAFFGVGVWEVIGISVLTSRALTEQEISERQHIESDSQSRMRTFSAQWRLLLGAVSFGVAAAFLIHDVTGILVIGTFVTAILSVTFCGALYLVLVSTYCPTYVLRRKGMNQRFAFLWLFAIALAVGCFLLALWAIKGRAAVDIVLGYFPFAHVVASAIGGGTILKSIWTFATKRGYPIFIRPMTYAERVRPK